jgi:hypothetical protein
MIFGHPINGVPEYTVKFEPIGTMGRYSTDNEELVLKLRKHPSFGKRFYETGITAQENPNIVRGLRSSETKPEIGKEPVDTQKLIEFGRLQATLLKNSGEYRKDASEEDRIKFEQLKLEIEENGINSK